jgi:outer membrane murein-binding lipoprotein Lpp
MAARRKCKTATINKKFALSHAADRVACSLRSDWMWHHPFQRLGNVHSLGLRGLAVPLRGFALLGIACIVAGCVNEHGSAGAGMQMLGASAVAADQSADLKRAAKQTVAARMLAAIALERVTGRTPDPSRFNELR